MPRARGHGWWPYLVPYVLFLVLVEVGRRTPDAWDGAMLVLRSSLPLAAFAAYAARGAYPELWRRGPGATTARQALGWGLDAMVGVASAALWVAPYVVFGALRPEPGQGFDPQVFGPGREGLALAVRALGYAVATPFVEELFVRSFLMRFVDVFDRGGDFRDVPVARFTGRSFVVVCIYFTLSHAPWEWPVALAWIVLTNLWFYRRRHLGAVVRVHAAANGSILAFVVLCDGLFRDAAGHPLPLWFLV